MSIQNVKVSTSQVENAVLSMVKECLGDAEKEIKQAIGKAGKETKETLTSNSPKKTGKYAQGWRVKMSNDKYGGYEAVVYNATKPSLTHLLELGHGGPHPAPAHPHMAPAFKKGRETLESELKK